MQGDQHELGLQGLLANVYASSLDFPFFIQPSSKFPTVSALLIFQDCQ